MRWKVSSIAMLLVFSVLTMYQPTLAATFITENFDTGPSDWRDAAGTATLNHIVSGGPEGSAYASVEFNFTSSFENDTPVIFRAQDEFGSSGGIFEGNWINDGAVSFSASVRHNASVPLLFFVRFASPFNYPGTTAMTFTPVQPNIWTRLSFQVYADSPQFISFEGSDFDNVFSDVGHIQIGVAVPSALAGVDYDYTFDIDKVTLNFASMWDAAYFVDPYFWNAGDANSTYQEWDTFTRTTDNKSDVGHITNPDYLPDPNLDVHSPGFISSSANFYSFNGNYSISADVYNHGGSFDVDAPAGYGTHVIVQTAATINDDPAAGGPASVLPESVKIVDFNDVPISGGSNSEALRMSEIWRGIVPSSRGDVIQQELIWEFFLPDYIGDFRVRMDNIVHCMFRQIRIDSMLASKPYDITAAPGPYDMDNDGDIDCDDFTIFARQWHMQGCSDENNWCSGGDFNNDGSVDMEDLTDFTTRWLEDSTLD